MRITVCKYFNYPRELRLEIGEMLINISLEWKHFRHKKGRKIILIDKNWVIPKGIWMDI
ncbi:hypothetical protein LCGC14_2114320 [marine sediment metagenome]|uniref:Uncharacterized protein n=1 Tax=marine sediment metagenome TaxID=412755 RepID=A0A0F9ET98_9ZZZZ